MKPAMMPSRAAVLVIRYKTRIAEIGNMEAITVLRMLITMKRRLSG